MQKILDAILSDDVDAISSLPVPDSYRGITVHADEADMFAEMPSRDKDPRLSLHLDEVPVPELGPGVALVAVMARAINPNTVRNSTLAPWSPLGFPARYARSTPTASPRLPRSLPSTPGACPRGLPADSHTGADDSVGSGNVILRVISLPNPLSTPWPRFLRAGSRRSLM